MCKALLTVTLIIFTFSSAKCKIAKVSDGKTKQIITTTAATPMAKDYQDGRNDTDVVDIMRVCNETFRIKMSYLEQLNNSGSFPDETDRTPKCYIRCVLETSGVASEDGQFDSRMAAEVLVHVRGGLDTNAIMEMASNCVEREETCKCERSYQFIKCLIEMEIEETEKEIL